MQCAVHHQMRGMTFDRHLFLCRLERADAVRKNDIAEHRLRRGADLLFLDHWKGEHVGRLVLAAPGRVERAHFHVGG